MLRAETLLARLSAAVPEATLAKLLKTVPLYSTSLSQVRGEGRALRGEG